MKFFLIGIKGSGMAALAGILQDDGYEVIGVDNSSKVFTENELSKRKIKVYEFPIDYRILDNISYVIIGHSFTNHEIVDKIKERNIPHLEYNEFIASYFKDLYQVAICGSHGKTTTTGYFYHGLKELIGVSMLRGDGIGIGGFANNFLVYEACEYKDHFLKYNPNTIIITNIDYDHVDYFKSKRQYNSSFNKFSKKAKTVFVNYGDKNKIYHHNKITYGFSESADYYLKNLHIENDLIYGEFYFHKTKLDDFHLPKMNKYNILHILSLMAFLHHNNFDYSKALPTFKNLPLAKRRLQLKVFNEDIYIDDYAHHPAQILASLETIKLLYPHYRYVGIFKPDRYSRLVEFSKEFKLSLNKFDYSYVLPLYEKVDVDTTGLIKGKNIMFIDNLSSLINHEKNMPKTIYLCMSSKNIDTWIYGLVNGK